MSKPKLTFLTNNGQPYPAWSMSLLKDAVEINPKTESLPKQFIYIDLEAVQGGALTSTKVYEKTDAPSRAQRLLKANDVLFQMVRPYQKNNYFFELEGSLPTVSSTGYAQLRSTENNPKFIYYTLHTDEFVKNVSDRCTGGTYPAINSSDLGKIPINIPCKEEQQKIAAFFTALDEKIFIEEKKTNFIKTLRDEIVNSIFNEISNDFNIVLTDVSDVRDGTHDSPKPVSHGYDLVTSKNLTEFGNIDFSECNKISEEDYININKRSKVDVGDILFGMIGTVGRPVFVDREGFAIKNVALIKPFSDKVCGRYLYYVIRSKLITNQLQSEMAGGNQKFVSLGKIRKLVVKIPDMKKQEDIVFKISLLDEKFDICRNKLNTLRKLKTAFMQQMFV